MSDANSQSSDVWTVGRIIDWTTRFLKEHGSDTPRLDTEILLAHVRSCTRIQLYTSFDAPLTAAERAAMRELVKRRANSEPVAYLVGHREFFGLDFTVNKHVLIPRPDTECLLVAFFDLANPRRTDPTPSDPTHVSNCSTDNAEKAVSELSDGGESPTFDGEKSVSEKPAESPIHVLDLCTGSGCICVSIATQIPKAQIVATDVSEAALEIALVNANRHHVADRISFNRGDLFDAVKKGTRFDYIVSNPPYVPSAEIETLDADVRNHEPIVALDAGVDGMKYLSRIVAGTNEYLKSGGWLILETGIEQAPLTLDLINSNGNFTDARVLKDLAGRPRVVIARQI